jgi:hypothetical protein
VFDSHFEQFKGSAQAIGVSVAAAYVPKPGREFLERFELENACGLRVKLAWEFSDFAKREKKLEKWSVYIPLLVSFALHLLTYEWSEGWFAFPAIIVVIVLAVRDVSSTKRRLNEVSYKAYQVAIMELERRRKAESVERERQLKKTAAANLKIRSSRNLSKSPMPSPMPRGVNPRGAEELCAKWMGFLGAIHVEVTKYASDGGIDVESWRHIAQVKNYSGTVGVAAIREFSGVAKVDGRIGLFFTSGNYAAGAIEFADKADIALFRYSAVLGELYAANSRAEIVLARGLI